MSPSPNISPGIFKGYYLEQLVQTEAQLLIDVFVKNGYHNDTLTRTATEFQNNFKKPEHNNANNDRIIGPKLRKELKKRF